MPLAVIAEPISLQGIGLPDDFEIMGGHSSDPDEQGKEILQTRFIQTELAFDTAVRRLSTFLALRLNGQPHEALGKLENARSWVAEWKQKEQDITAQLTESDARCIGWLGIVRNI